MQTYRAEITLQFYVDANSEHDAEENYFDTIAAIQQMLPNGVRLQSYNQLAVTGTKSEAA